MLNYQRVSQPISSSRSHGISSSVAGEVLLIVFRRGSWSQGSFEGLTLQLMGVLLKVAPSMGPLWSSNVAGGKIHYEWRF